MKIENTFEVDAPVEEAWALLMDVPRVIPCMPGAELTETLDADRWKATMSVKLGPISLVFATDVTRETADEAARLSRSSARSRAIVSATERASAAGTSGARSRTISTSRSRDGKSIQW